MTQENNPLEKDSLPDLGKHWEWKFDHTGEYGWIAVNQSLGIEVSVGHGLMMIDTHNDHSISVGVETSVIVDVLLANGVRL